MKMVNRYLVLGALLSGTIHGAMLLALAGFSLDSQGEQKEREVVVSLGSVSIVKEAGGEGKELASLFRQSSDLLAYYRERKQKEKKKQIRKQRQEQREKKLKKERKKRKKKSFQRKEKTAVKKKKTPERKTLVASRKEGTDRKVPSKPTPLSSPAPPSPSFLAEPERAGPAGGRTGSTRGSQSGGKAKLLASAGNYRKEYLNLNLGLIRELIRKEVQYPYMARKMGWEGKVVIGVVLTPEGCKEVKLVRSSGFPLLDENALSTVKRVCGKFPKPKRKVSLQVPILYRLKE